MARGGGAARRGGERRRTLSRLVQIDHVTRHIAIVAPPTPGHINPLVALGTALVARGHRVTFVHLPSVASLIPPSTIGFAALGGIDDLDAHYRRLAQPTGARGLMRMIRSTAAITRTLLDELPATLDRIGADAVLADSVEPAGALVARHLGLPYVTSVTGLPLIREPAVPPPFLGWGYRPDAIGRFRNAGGYAVSDRLMAPITRTCADRARYWGLSLGAPYEGSARLQIAQCPAGLDFPRDALPASFRYGAPWRTTEASVPLPDDDRPLIFCSLGSLQGARVELFASITRACAAVGGRALVAHGGMLTAEEAAGLPGDPVVGAFWPQTRVLRHCAAAVLHGGFNTVLDALAAGIPIVAIPIAFEQPATARRLEHVGAGRIVTRRQVGARHLEAALRAVLGDLRYTRSARQIGAEIAGGGGAAAAAAAIVAAL